MPLHRIIHRADKLLFIEQRKQVIGLIHRDHAEVHAQIAATGNGHFHPVNPLLRACQHNAAGDMRTAALARDGFNFLIKLNGILLKFRHIGISVDGVHTARRMPGGTGSQLRPLQQHHVLPTQLGQMIQHRCTDHATANNHNLSMGFHHDVLKRVENSGRKTLEESSA